MALPNEIGRKVRLINTNDRFTRLKPFDQGVITDITTLPANMGGNRQFWIKWSNGSRLALIENYDSFEILDK